MIVADTNLIASLLLPGVRTQDAQRVFAADRAWAVPMLWRSEFRNVLLGYVRKKALALADAVRIAAHAESMVKGREHVVSSEVVLQLAFEYGCTADDCEFVAVARRLRVPLVTSDGALLKQFRNLAVAPELFARAV